MPSSAADPARFRRSQHPFRRFAVLLALFVALSLLIVFSANPPVSQRPLHRPAVPAAAPKYAFATFYTEDAETEEDDRYLICTRMLAYQLLHDPHTRTNTSIPFVVLVPPGVAQSKRHRLASEGATVVQVPAMNFTWMKPGRHRWAEVMDKLHVYRLVQFDKVLLLDSDVVIFRRLDGVFESPGTEIRTNLGHRSNIKADEGAQPSRYLLAGDSAPQGGVNHTWPAPRIPGPCNAGFVVVHPSEDMYRHNVRIAAIEGRFSGTAPEQNLWNYIHRLDGNMPWSRLENTWIMNSPVYNDYTMGIAAVHEKWFRNSHKDLPLKAMLQRSRWRMEGFWSKGV